MPYSKKKWKWILTVFFLTVIFFSSSFGQININISWDANNEQDLKGYKIYYGLNPGEYAFHKDVGKTTLESISIQDSTDYYVVVTAYDTSGNESNYSKEVFVKGITNQSDFNRDGNTDFADMIVFDAAFGKTLENSKYYLPADFNRDGKVDFADMVVFDKEFGSNK